MADYHLIDEPMPTGLSKYVVPPFWILMGLMLGGAWLAFPWLVFNAHAVGSPTKAREIGLVIGYFIVAVVLSSVIILGHGVLWPPVATKYLALLVLAAKIGIAYWVIFLQARTFALYEEFGGQVQNPALVLVAGWILRGYVLPEPTNALRTILLLVMA